MLDHATVTELLAKYWPDEYQISGPENVKNIVEDVIAGNTAEDNFVSSNVGDNFDIIPMLGIILGAAQLIVAIIQLLADHKDKEASRSANQSDMQTVVFNYINVIQPKAWEMLTMEQRADFVDHLIEKSLREQR